MLDRINDFLKFNGLDVAGIDREELLRTFDQEMTAGLKGEASSLAMIPSFISIDKKVRINQPVVVLDAGGTNLRTAVVEMNEKGVCNIGEFKKRSMPGTEEELNNDEFFKAFADFVTPNLTVSNPTVGFCFSYAAEITPDCDAKLLYWSKQIMAPGIVGELVGRGLSNELEKENISRRFIILNDTVATLLAGKSSGVSHSYSAYVGFILGTGTNTAYVESNANITKRSDLQVGGSMVINVESGGFKNIKQCRFDTLLDQRTNDPGSYTFEKMISGAYLGLLGSVVLIESAKAGLFSAAAAERILGWDGEGGNWQPVANADLDDFCGDKPDDDNPFLDPSFSDADREIVKALCTPVYERAAVLAAVNIASAIIKTGAGKDQKSPVCVNVDGSTYYKTLAADFQQRVQNELKDLLENRDIAYELVRVDDSPVIGAAVAGLMV
ncbi:MAG: hexokinase [Kiritimatiellae bacterium]|jgi:hexokinase|nr:hexokinase [Kiritimatiellia bacterium]